MLAVELEADPSGQQRDDELVEAHALLSSDRRELCVQPGGQAHEELPAGFHEPDSITGGIDIADTAGDTKDMSSLNGLQVVLTCQRTDCDAQVIVDADWSLYRTLGEILTEADDDGGEITGWGEDYEHPNSFIHCPNHRSAE